MVKLRDIAVRTPVGIFHIIIDTSDVARASGFGELADVAVHLPEGLHDAVIEPVASHPYERAVTAYFVGDASALECVRREQDGSEFQEAVWHAMSAIPYGQTRSYAELARDAGYPRAIRAVGSACGRNRLALLVPCHRVVRSDGSVGTYLYGLAVKERLLRGERGRLVTGK